MNRTTLILSSLVAANSFAQPPADIVLTATWRPPSHARIDCRGGTIRPAATYGDGFVPSTPDTLIFLKDVIDVEIRNCVLEGADQAIVIARGGSHTIAGNTVEAKWASIDLVATSHNRVQDNLVQYGVAGIRTRGDSDHNRISRNTVAHADPGPEVRDFNGPAIGSWSTPYAAVINVIVDGELTQILNSVHMLDDHHVTDNDVDATGGFVGVGLMGRTRNGLARGNRVNGGFHSAASFGYDFVPVVLPGWCSEDASRRCRPWYWNEDFFGDDCYIPWFDAAPDKGVCVGAAEVPGPTNVINSRFIDNTIAGGFIGLAGYYAPTSRFEGNRISGCARGIEIGDWMLQSGAVVGNVVTDSAIGLSLSNFDAGYAGATVSYNDFIGNQTAISTEQWRCDNNGCYPDAPYTLDTVLPGNHWGSTCAPADLPAHVTTPGSYAAPVADAYLAGDDLGPTCN